MKNRIILRIVSAIILVAGLPLFLDYCIFGNSMPSNLSNTEWASFLGSYLGAIIGAVIALIGVTATISFTSKQNKESNELHVRPYFDIKYKITKEFIGVEKQLGRLAYTNERSARVEEGKNQHSYGIIYFKNVGIGPAINCHFENVEINDNRKHGPMLFADSYNVVNVNSLQAGEEGGLLINILWNFDPVEKSSFIFEQGEYYPSQAAMTKYKSHNICFDFIYADILGNVFSQKIRLKVQIGIMHKNDVGHYSADVFLEEVMQPERQ